jgi:hypothetical protein
MIRGSGTKGERKTGQWNHIQGEEIDQCMARRKGGKGKGAFVLPNIVRNFRAAGGLVLGSNACFNIHPSPETWSS